MEKIVITYYKECSSILKKFPKSHILLNIDLLMCIISKVQKSALLKKKQINIKLRNKQYFLA